MRRSYYPRHVVVAGKDGMTPFSSVHVGEATRVAAEYRRIGWKPVGVIRITSLDDRNRKLAAWVDKAKESA